jgi:hypothetical protein
MSCAQVALVPLVFAAAHQEQMVHVPLAAGTFAAPPGGSRCKRYSSQLLVGGCCCCRAANACPHRSHVAPECCGVAIDDHAAAQIVVGGGVQAMLPQCLVTSVLPEGVHKRLIHQDVPNQLQAVLYLLLCVAVSPQGMMAR